MENFVESYAKKHDLKFEFKFERLQGNFSNMAVKIPNTGFTVQRIENTPLIEYRLIKNHCTIWSMEGSEDPTEAKIHSLIRLLRKPLKQMNALCNKVHSSKLIGTRLVWGPWVSMYFDVEAGTFEVIYADEDLTSTPACKLVVKEVFKLDEFEKAEALFLKMYRTGFVLNMLSVVFEYIGMNYRFLYDPETGDHHVTFKARLGDDEVPTQTTIKPYYTQIGTVDLWILENGTINHKVLSIDKFSPHSMPELRNHLTCWLLSYTKESRHE